MRRYLLIILIIYVINSIALVHAEQKLIKLLDFKHEQTGYASLNNNDDSLLINYFDGTESKGIYWFKQNKTIKSIPNVTEATFSPDGKYYTYVKSNLLFVFNEMDSLVYKFLINYTEFDRLGWSYDSKLIYTCEHLKDKYIVFCFDIKTGKKIEILKSNRVYFHPVTVKNRDIIYLLENTNSNGVGFYCNIVKFDLESKKIEPIKLPKINDLWISDTFTISPDGNIIIFCNDNDGIIYIVDALNSKIIEKIETPMNARPGGYDWKSDGSYFIFTMTGKEIYKYTVPSGISFYTTQINFLTLGYAKKFHQFPGGKELSEKEQQEQIAEANSLSDEGFNYYQAKKDDLAIAKYEEALTHYASAEIYYRYGNSLSNIPRLEDAVKAYQIAIELNYDKPYLVYYNIACVYSRMNHSKEAFANLELAINNGYKNFDHIQKDEDLAWLRSQPEWKEWWGKHQQ